MSEPRAADLEHVTPRLRRAEEDLLAEYERNAAMLATIGIGSATIVGRGSSAHGAVMVETDSSNRMTDIQLEPRALRLGSLEALQRAILSAYTAATADAAEQRAEAGLGVPDQAPLRSLLDQMPEVAALLPETEWDQVLHQEDRAEDDTDSDDVWKRGAS